MRTRNVNASVSIRAQIILAICATGFLIFWLYRNHREALERAAKIQLVAEQQLVESRRQKAEAEHQDELRKRAEIQIQSLLSYSDSLVSSAKAALEHFGPDHPIIGEHGLQHGEKAGVGIVRFIKSPYPSLQQIESALGKPSKCDKWQYQGEVMETWCIWSVEKPDAKGQTVSVQANFSPKLDQAIQKLTISTDVSDGGYVEEEIGRKPDLWSKTTHQ